MLPSASPTHTPTVVPSLPEPIDSFTTFPLTAPTPEPTSHASVSLSASIKTALVQSGTTEFIVDTQTRTELSASTWSDCAVVSTRWLSSINVENRSLFATDSDGLWLVVRGGALSEGQRYTFGLVVTDDCGALAAAHNITLVANRAPAGGLLELTPSTGFALTTRFVLCGRDWTDADDDGVPLTYQFAFVSSSGVRVAVSDDQVGINTSVRALLPAGNRTLILVVTDWIGSSGTASAHAVVMRPFFDSPGRCDTLLGTVQNQTQAAAALIAAGQGIKAMILIAACAESLPWDIFTDCNGRVAHARNLLLRSIRNATAVVGLETATSVELQSIALDLVLNITLTNLDAAVISLAIDYAASVANRSRPLGRIPAVARQSLVRALSSILESAAVLTPSPLAISERIPSVLLCIHLLTEIAPGEEQTVTVARSLSIGSVQTSCALGCPNVTIVQSPSLLIDDSSGAVGFFELSAAVLSEMSLGVRSNQRVGLFSVTWRYHPWAQKSRITEDGVHLPAIDNNSTVFTLSATSGGEELPVGNLSSPISLSLPITAWESDVVNVTSSSLSATAISSSTTGETEDATIITCSMNVRSHLCLESLPCNGLNCKETTSTTTTSWQRLDLCSYWDEQTSEWSSEGLLVVENSAGGVDFVRCETSHATEFVAVRGAKAVVETLTSVRQFRWHRVNVILLILCFLNVFAGCVALRDYVALRAIENRRAQAAWRSEAFQTSLQWLQMPRRFDCATTHYTTLKLTY